MVGSGFDKACSRLSEKQLLTLLSDGRLGREGLALRIGAPRAGSTASAEVMQGFYLLVVRAIVIRFAVHGSHAMAHHTHAFVTHHAHPGMVVSHYQEFAP